MKEAHDRNLDYVVKVTFARSSNALFEENVCNLYLKKKSSDGGHNDMLSLKVPKGLKDDAKTALILMIYAQLVEIKFSGVNNVFEGFSMHITKELMYKAEQKLVKLNICEVQENILNDQKVVDKILEKMKELGENGKVVNLVFVDFDNCQQLLQQKPELLKSKENLFFVLFYAKTLKHKIEGVFKHLKSSNIKINVLSVECKSLKNSADFCMANVGAALDFRIGDRKKLCFNLKWFCLSGDNIFQAVTLMLNNVELLPNPHFGLQPVWQCLNRLNNICFSKDGSYFAIISPESVSVIETRNGNYFCKIPQTDAQSVALSPLGSYLAILGKKTSNGFPVYVYYVKENRYLVKKFHIKQIGHWRPQFSNDEKNCLLYEEEESNEEKMKFYRVSSTDFEILCDFDLPDDCTEFSFFGKNSTYTLALLRHAKIYEEEISVLTLLDPTEHNTKGNSCLQLGDCGPMQMFGNCLGTCLLLMSLNGSKKLVVAIRPLNDESDEWTMFQIDVGGIILNVQWSSGGDFFCVKSIDSLKIYNLKAENILTLPMNKYTNCDLYIKDEHLYKFLCTSSDKIKIIKGKPICQGNMDVSYPIVAARLCDNGKKVFIVTSNQDILKFESLAIVLPEIKTKITLNLIGRSRPNANELISEFMQFVGKRFIRHVKTSLNLKSFTFEIRRDMMTKARDFTFQSYDIKIKQGNL